MNVFRGMTVSISIESFLLSVTLSGSSGLPEFQVPVNETDHDTIHGALLPLGSGTLCLVGARRKY